jgi:hypothetical protein
MGREGTQEMQDGRETQKGKAATKKGNKIMVTSKITTPRAPAWGLFGLKFDEIRL